MDRIGSRLATAGKNTASTIASDRAIVAFLIAVFILRTYLSDWNSYWNDEILSVYVHGIWNPTIIDSVVTLSENSVHPPFYQFLLYAWMSVFGDGEVATRMLSNVAVTLSGYVLYRIVRHQWSRYLAFVAGASYSVMAVSMTYAVESRSYGLTMLLATVSMALLLKTLLALKSSGNWSIGEHWPSVIGVVLANIGLIMTHYYNLFWLIAQALALLLFILTERHPRDWWRPLLVGASLSLAAPLAFLALWGQVFFGRYGRLSDSFAVEGSAASTTPWDLFIAVVLRQNLADFRFIVPAVAILLAMVGVLSLWRIFANRQSRLGSRDWLYAILLIWSSLPLLITYVVFTIAGVERYSLRYFVYSVPPLTALVVIGIATLVLAIQRKSLAATEPGNLVSTATALLIALMVVPAGFDAATDRKHDWRGNVARVIQVVEASPETDYFLVETGFQERSRAIVYFERYSDEIRPDRVFTMAEERSGDYSQLLASIPTDADRMLVFFNHLGVKRMPDLPGVLDAEFTRIHAQLDVNGRGYIVWDLARPTE
ncbi:glycosyltransferase family 39 protein [Microcella pacifica]|uniref:Glycosyltransferase family 39 protein n=1 Tax=Microcella pacifica TaxID=2591847 RepID=A0A9E5MFN6_9MICO|nr:glycosyltransferase family 39 protein [Microcella pacifica]NHF63917.1 glycosyltransferase family 39 protein [Microcella pacifica]